MAAQKSSVASLDPALREAIDAAIAGGRVTIDELVRMVRDAGGEVSRSAMGRYSANHAQALAEYREGQALARQWMVELKENPDGDVAQLVAQQLKMQAHRIIINRDPNAPLDIEAVGSLSKALRDLALGDKTRAELRKGIEDALAKRFDAAAERESKGKPDMAAALKRIREEVYGLRPA